MLVGASVIATTSNEDVAFVYVREVLTAKRFVVVAFVVVLFVTTRLFTVPDTRAAEVANKLVVAFTVLREFDVSVFANDVLAVMLLAEKVVAVAEAKVTPVAVRLVMDALVVVLIVCLKN
jgi:hypothetical protein